MDQQITRPILWNVPFAFIVAMYALLALLVIAFIYAGMYWYRRISLGTTADRFDQPLRRTMLAVRDAIGQGYVIREAWGWMHYSFYVAFIGLAIGTTIVLINSDVREIAALFGVPVYFYYGDFYLIFKAAMDVFFLMLIGGVLAAAARRYLRKPSLLNSPPADKLLDNLENRLGYWFPLMMLVLVGLTGLMLEGARINAHPPKFTEWAFVGRNVGAIEGALGAGPMFHRSLWAVHVLFVYTLLFAFPFSKIRHVLIAPINLYFRNLKPRGRLEPIKDFETAETFGVSQVEQYSWKQLLDMASCLECGRCTINCPTASTGKTLNPKYLVITQREHLLDKAPAILAARAATNGDGKTPEVDYSGPDMITQVATEAAVWGCTSCGWCEEGCPVGIEHIQRIVDMRRHLVLMESKFPQEATGAFKGIEVQGNPWGLGQEKRADWAKGLDIPSMAELEDPSAIDVLYWVGCAGSYDERNQKVSRAFASLMKQARIRFAILGTEETCTGDPARRLGNEYLYATVAAQNVETLNRYKPPRIVTQCPHCFHNIKNEYPDFGGSFEITHAPDFIAELIAAGRLKPNVKIPQRVTYHDPCYMARHNREWSGARAALSAIPGAELTDVDQSKHRTFCCGAGGGCFWKEEERLGERINERRFDQLSKATPETIGVGCPFCMTMLEDAVKSHSKEESMRVRDVVELVAESTGSSNR
ncbi:MAG TPA: (Fe-S)-binding protein [Candidatus Binataceae bacterium]|nr:(Fe-S)-binding protein [Candidatus Binataceae bacterium]